MTADTMLVSVVMPAYNAERTVREAVDSVLSQTGAELELIAVDDGSTDGTLAVLSAIDDPRLVIVSGRNAGAAAARNRGIARARGGTVAFIDADDVWLAGKLAAQLAALSRSPAAAAAFCWVDHVDAVGRYVCPDRRI